MKIRTARNRIEPHNETVNAKTLNLEEIRRIMNDLEMPIMIHVRPTPLRRAKDNVEVASSEGIPECMYKI